MFDPYESGMEQDSSPENNCDNDYEASTSDALEDLPVDVEGGEEEHENQKNSEKLGEPGLLLLRSVSDMHVQELPE